MKTNFWTIPDGIIARNMNEDGKSAREIGAALGRTRNSVIGWFHRAGISLDKVSPNKVVKEVKAPKIRKPSPPQPI